jgi:hypothetical protein
MAAAASNLLLLHLTLLSFVFLLTTTVCSVSGTVASYVHETGGRRGLLPTAPPEGSMLPCYFPICCCLLTVLPLLLYAAAAAFYPLPSFDSLLDERRRLTTNLMHGRFHTILLYIHFVLLVDFAVQSVAEMCVNFLLSTAQVHC